MDSVMDDMDDVDDIDEGVNSELAEQRDSAEETIDTNDCGAGEGWITCSEDEEEMTMDVSRDLTVIKQRSMREWASKLRDLEERALTKAESF